MRTQHASLNFPKPPWNLRPYCGFTVIIGEASYIVVWNCRGSWHVEEFQLSLMMLQHKQTTCITFFWLCYGLLIHSCWLHAQGFVYIFRSLFHPVFILMWLILQYLALRMSTSIAGRFRCHMDCVMQEVALFWNFLGSFWYDEQMGRL